MKTKIFALILALTAVITAFAQSSPGFVYGQVPTPGQWNGYFANKMDYPGSPGPAGYVWTSNGTSFQSLPPAAAGNLSGGTQYAIPYQTAPSTTAFLGAGAGFLIENSGAPAWLSFGTSVNNPGTGTAESLLPVQTVTGTSYTFATVDLFKKTRRSNSGTSMTDTFPASTATGLVDGTQINITNTDSSATDTVTAGAGTTIAGSSSFVVQPGRDVWWAYDASNTAWRVVANTSSTILFTGTPATASQGWCGSSTPGEAVACSIASGTVSSVGLSLPSIFSVSDSPVTTSGTLTGSLATQSANTVWAGPSSGSAAAPTFRNLVTADLPTNGQVQILVTTSAVEPGSSTAVSSGLSANVVAGGTYTFEIYYYLANVSNSTMSLNFGTATMTSINGIYMPYQTAGQDLSQAISSFSSTFNKTASGTLGYFATGSFVVNAGGTFVPGFASASSATDTLSIGSWMRITRVQ